MNDTPTRPIDVARAVAQADPSALLVPPRILRRVIKKHQGLGGLGLRVPHPRVYLITRDALLGIVTPEEIGLADPAALPEQLVLLPRPHDSRVRKHGAAVELRDLWRLLFHAHAHRALAKARAAGTLDAAGLRGRIERLGSIAFEEARAVLRQENALFHPHDDAEVYEEFACVWLELKYFEPARLHDYFPAMLDAAAAEAVFTGDVDAGALFALTRPEGAAEPAGEEHEEPAGPDAPEKEDTAGAGTLCVRADRMAAGGNLVRAAILRTKAVAKAPPTQAGPLRAAARQGIELLAMRLERALRFPERQRPEWARCLLALLEPASRGIWNAEARLLYDLQKVCVDNEREIFAADLSEWFLSYFQRPVKRLLPDQPLVLTVKNLREALAKLPRARIPDEERGRLRELIQEALTRAELELRQRLHPRLVAAMDSVGLVPRNAAERLSRDRIVEELLDLVVRRCYLTFGDLRDAIARSRVKLPDLVNPIEFFTGDPLIRLNSRLAVDLDGIYHRGEIYLRGLQRLSSLFFGNPIGRAVTLYLLLPMLGAFFIIKGANVLMEEAHTFTGWPRYHPYADAADAYESGELAGPAKSLYHRSPELGDLHGFFGVEEEAFTYGSYAVMGVFLLLMLHWPAFRRVVLHGAYLVYLGLHALFYDLPAAFFALPAVRAVLQSRPYLIFWAFAAKPALGALPLALLMWLIGVPWDWLAIYAGGFALLLSVLMNTRPGLLAQEAATDWSMRSAQLIREDVLPGLFRAIIYVFRRLLERVDQLVYTVDEWLRFRGGESKASFYGKLVLGLFWALVTFVIRFAVNLLIEPQINPIKHFPVVTVSHKLSLLAIGPVSGATGLSPGIVAFVLGLIPGVFGFLAWELKENWKLYRANESPTLDPEMVGSHGEHVIHLIRPGFHSGTLPKLFAKLRHAEGASHRKAEAEVHHVEEGLRHFLDRNLVAWLAASKGWSMTASVVVGHVNLATNRIRAELCCAAIEGESVLLDFENRGGYLVASLARRGWLASVGDGPLAAFVDLLAGLYKKAGVDLVAEDLRAHLPAEASWEVTEGGLKTWAGPDGANASVSRPGEPNGAGLWFRDRPLPWSRWVEVWERDHKGEAHRPQALPGATLV
jgi:hypothetical protein